MCHRKPGKKYRFARGIVFFLKEAIFPMKWAV
jgi:hypothetical protein